MFIKQNIMYKKRKREFLNVCYELNPKIINNDNWEARECPICHNIFYVRKKYSKITCSKECYNEYIKLHKEEINEKKRISCINSYNKKTKEEISKEHEKARNTCLKKYGVDMYQKTNEYRKKMSEMFKNKDWGERSKKQNEQLIPKYKQICENDCLELLEFRNRYDCTVQCKKCGSIFDVHVLGYLSEYSTHNLCRKCFPNKNTLSTTKPMKFIEDILIENNISYIKNDRLSIHPYEIDFYIDDLKLGIEINGNYWHSEIGGGRDSKYHINKTIKANLLGIKLIQIFEDEIINKPDIVKSRVENLLKVSQIKIYARKCKIKEVDYLTKSDFFNENHIDGDAVSKYNFGLYYNDKLVSCASFGNRKISGAEQFELIRFANIINVNVVGGFSKLLKHFIEKYNPQKLVTYADIRWSGINSKDSVYEKCGFKFISQTQPNYFYIDRHNYLVRMNRLNFTKQKLKKLGYNVDLTEAQIMFNNGYDKIWDCGSMKFEYIVE